MGLFSRKKKEEPDEEMMFEEQIREIRENGLNIEVAVGTHGNDEIVAGAMMGSTGKLIAMSNYGKPIFQSTKLYMLPEGIRFQFNGEYFDYQEIYEWRKKKVGLLQTEFIFVTTRGEVLVKVSNGDFLAFVEIFDRDVAAYSVRLEAEEKQAQLEEEQNKAESDMDRLIRLGELHERGLLSDEEFAEAKKKLLK